MRPGEPSSVCNLNEQQEPTLLLLLLEIAGAPVALVR